MHNFFLKKFDVFWATLLQENYYTKVDPLKQTNSQTKRYYNNKIIFSDLRT